MPPAGCKSCAGPRSGVKGHSRRRPRPACREPPDMRILVATDAWHPQVNGVVRTYERLAREARVQGAEVVFLSASEFTSLPCPSYPSIRLAIPNWKRAGELIEAARPDFVHVATEGPVGLMARSFCLRNKRPFTTSYHTKFPEDASALLSIPPRDRKGGG